MAQFVSVHPKKRKKLLRNFFYRLFYRKQFKKISELLFWDTIEITPSQICLRMLWNGQQFEFDKDEVSFICFESQFMKIKLFGENYKKNVDLDIIKIYSKRTTQHIALNFIQNSDELLRELHDFIPIWEYEGDREKNFNESIDKYCKELLRIEQSIRERGITEPMNIIEEYNRIITTQHVELQPLSTLAQKVERSFREKRFANKFILNKLISIFNEQSGSSKNHTILFWNEMLKFLFRGDYSIGRQWAINKVDELGLGFNKKYYTHLLETFGIGPLFGTNFEHPEWTEHQFTQYQNAVHTLSPLTHESSRLAATIINNVYDRLIHTEISDKETYDNYLRIVVKYVLMPEDMKNRIPEYNKEKFSESKVEIDSFFSELFEKIPKAHWEFKDSKFNLIKELLESNRKQHL